MSFFGDFDEDDALDTEPFDPEQVARRLVKYRQDHDPSLPSWDDLPNDNKGIEIESLIRLFAWMRRQGSFR